MKKKILQRRLKVKFGQKSHCCVTLWGFPVRLTRSMQINCVNNSSTNKGSIYYMDQQLDWLMGILFLQQGNKVNVKVMGLNPQACNL